MYKDPMDDIFESFVKAAVIESGLRESENCPQEKELNYIHLSTKCERSITKNACKLKRKKKLLKLSKYMQKTAAAVLITVGVSFGFFLSSNEVRSSCFDTLIKVYSKFVDFRAGNNVSSNVTLNITYVPEGYKEFSRNQSNNKMTIEYKNDQDKILTLRCTKVFSNLQMDNEHYILKTENLPIKNATLLIARNSKFQNKLYWDSESYSLMIEAFLPEDELFKIAKNVELSVSK